MKTFIIFILALTLSLSNATEINAFTSDGCSAFPDGTIKENTLWLNCCIAHDIAYWKGGSSDLRQDADKALEQCVASLGQTKTSRLMYIGVRVGGTPYLPTSFRWGYGWPFARGYQAHSPQEIKSIEKQLKIYKENQK